MLARLLSLIFITLLTACSGEPDTGPLEIKWDRDACERCRMVLSDPHFAAQIRYYPAGKKRSVVEKFDDFGCAALWLEDKPWKDDGRTEFWVADHRSKEWIDATTATYVLKKTTPMEYGLGAQLEAVSGSMSFDRAKVHISEVEQRFNVHGLQLEQRLREQAKQRENTQ